MCRPTMHTTMLVMMASFFFCLLVMESASLMCGLLSAGTQRKHTIYTCYTNCTSTLNAHTQTHTHACSRPCTHSLTTCLRRFLGAEAATGSAEDVRERWRDHLDVTSKCGTCCHKIVLSPWPWPLTIQRSPYRQPYRQLYCRTANHTVNCSNH